MKVHIGWIGVTVIALLVIWYFNPMGVVCNVKSAL